MTNQLKVLVIGGYGEFGGRLSELLIRDGHTVLVAGRQLTKAQLHCQQYGGEPVQFDMATDLDKIATLHVDVVVDAAGPFQSYGLNDQRYRVALRALNCDAHYLDLSDDGQFTQDIVTLDIIAKKHSRVALSGASSTPALSGAAVSAMKNNFASIEKIETSILPGSRAPQGYSVMQAILAQVGNPIKFWRNNEWVDCSGWSEPASKSVGEHLTRKANLITAADVVLFPKHFNARSVVFRAGLAMPIMNNSLQWLGSIRQRGWIPPLTKFIKPLRTLANMISPLGDDHGGMLVEVVGEPANNSKSEKNDLLKTTWTLKAGPRHGPYVPTIAVRTLLQHIHLIEPGARACIDELPLDKFVAAMHDIDITTDTHQNEFVYLFKNALGAPWHSLPAPLQKTHCVVDRVVLTGSAKVTRGTSLIGRLIATLFRFPTASNDTPLQVTKTRIGDVEVWQRNFAGKTFQSTLSKIRSTGTQYNHPTIQEQFGLMKFTLELPIIDNAMHMHVVKGSCLGIPIPRWLLPVSNTREYVKNNRMHFSVELLGPLNIGLFVRYEGSLE